MVLPVGNMAIMGMTSFHRLKLQAVILLTASIPAEFRRRFGKHVQSVVVEKHPGNGVWR